MCLRPAIEIQEENNEQAVGKESDFPVSFFVDKA